MSDQSPGGQYQPPPVPPPAPTQPRQPLAQQPAEPGWWQASDGRWYPPEAQPGGQVAPYGQQGKSRLAAGLLGIFLGAFGVHNFYLGYTGKAIAQLVLTLTCIGYLVSWPWGLIEGILILTESENFRTDANGVPLVK